MLGRPLCASRARCVITAGHNGCITVDLPAAPQETNAKPAHHVMSCCIVPAATVGLASVDADSAAAHRRGGTGGTHTATPESSRNEHCPCSKTTRMRYRWNWEA
jgi:hypothetical protein